MTAANIPLDEAIACHAAGDTARAEMLYRAVLAAAPDNLAARVNLAILALGRGNAGEALVHADHALAADRNYAAAWNVKGLAVARSGQPRAALAHYDRALHLQPGYLEAAANRAAALIDLTDFEGAAQACRQILRDKPNFAAASCILGIALSNLRQFDEALASQDSALAHAPDMPEAHNERGSMLRRMGRTAEAVAAHTRAIALNPRFAASYNNRGIALQYLRRYSESIESYDAAIAISPGFADAHWNRSLALLLLGDYERGWAAYEWRWTSAAMRHLARTFSVPQWRGEEIAGKTILIHAEQGLGDTLQFCRYAGLVAARGAKVVLEVPKPLARLDGVTQLITAGDIIPAFDVHSPLMSLPMAFRTTVEAVPACVPYVKADPDLAAAWAARLGAKTRPRVGVVWAGKPGNFDNQTRSLPVSALAPLLRADIELHCLQKEIAVADRAWIESHGDMIFLDQDLKDFADTAGLITALDLVIAVDTAVAHLSGALGQATWVLLAYAADYRWLADRPDSPWYPTARLFRQDAPGDWAGVLTAVVNRLGAPG